MAVMSELSVAQQLLISHNQYRIFHNLTKLRLDPRLIAMAEEHVQWMHDNKILSSNGTRTLLERFDFLNYRAMVVGENLAKGCDIQEVMGQWIRSRAKVLETSWYSCGFAKAGNYWYSVFALPIQIVDSTDRLGFENYKPRIIMPLS